MRPLIVGFVGIAVAAPLAAAAQAVSERVTEATRIEGIVFEDRNGDGRWEAGEPGLPGVAVSDQVQVVMTDQSGRLALSSGQVRAASGEVIGRFNSIWRRDPDGQWRVVFDKGSS